MVKYSDDRLDLIFSALSDRTRRGLLARLASGKTFSVSELAQPLDMSLPAVMKHLDVLAEAGLVSRTKEPAAPSPAKWTLPLCSRPVNGSRNMNDSGPSSFERLGRFRGR